MEQWSDEGTWPTKRQGTGFNAFDVWPQSKTISHTTAPVYYVTCIAILFVEFFTQLKYGKKSQVALFQNVQNRSFGISQKSEIIFASQAPVILVSLLLNFPKFLETEVTFDEESQQVSETLCEKHKHIYFYPSVFWFQ